MPQLKTNTVTVTNGSNSVVGSGTAWLTGPNPVTVGAYLIISDENGGSPTVYEVQTIPSDTSLTLTTNWAGVTGTYNAVIHIDFLPNGVPQLTSGDLETVAVINRAHKILGDDIASGTAAATTTTRGTVEKATSTEAIAGTADDKFPDVKGVKAHVDGRVTSSAIDTTVGRLLKVGDFGLGGSNIAGNRYTGDIDVLFLTGFYFLGADSSGTKPTVFGDLAVVSNGSDGACQIMIQQNTTADFMWIRHYFGAGGGWTSWKRMLHTGNTIVDSNGFLKEV